jgi:cytoplasmic polyadenylation element-binding protein
MDVNCCPRNDFSFPTKNSTKEIISTWPTTLNGNGNGGSNENIFDQEPKQFQDYILRNTSNLISHEQSSSSSSSSSLSCILPFQQLVINDLNNQHHSSSLPFTFNNNNNEALPFGTSHQHNINDENARPPWLLSIAPVSQISPPFLQQHNHQSYQNQQQQSILPMLSSSQDDTTENIRHWIGDFSNEQTNNNNNNNNTNNNIQQIPLLSQKVFIGGVPRFATETDIHANFDRFGVFEIQWPKLHGGHKEQHRENGFFHIVFHNAKSVCALLDSCSRHTNNNACADYFIHFETATGSRKTVEVIPWNIGDNNYALRPPQQLDSKKTIFVGNLHGTMTARYLWRLMEDLFSGAVYAGVDIDKYKYPIGSGRVTFDNSSSFLHAVSTAFVDVRTPRFLKRLQIEPHLQYRFCSLCKTAAGDLFCRNFACFDYFCQRCWQKIHIGSMASHKAVTRHSKSSQPVFHPIQQSMPQPLDCIVGANGF